MYTCSEFNYSKVTLLCITWVVLTKVLCVSVIYQSREKRLKYNIHFKGSCLGTVKIKNGCPNTKTPNMCR
jgi:hypothetical protein